MAECDENGLPLVVLCPGCKRVFSRRGMNNHKKTDCGIKKIRQLIQKKKARLYYITHKEQINKNRKKYKRQSWNERMDNPKNKRSEL